MNYTPESLAAVLRAELPEWNTYTFGSDRAYSFSEDRTFSATFRIDAEPLGSDSRFLTAHVDVDHGDIQATASWVRRRIADSPDPAVMLREAIEQAREWVAKTVAALQQGCP